MSTAPLAATALRIGPEGLALSEQLVLAGLRCWARARMAGHAPQGLVRPSLTHVASKPVAMMFVAMMERIERDAARPMQVHCVACRGYSHDEQRVVLACGLAPADPEVAMRLLSPLVNAPEAPVLLARTLNLALGEAGYPMPVRMWREGAAPATIH